MLKDLTKKLQEQIDNDDIACVMSAEDIARHAFMLTQYDRCGSVSHQELTDYITNEIMQDPSISDINEYLTENRYFDDVIYSWNDFDEVFQDEEPFNIFKRVYFGKVNFTDDYWKFNGYGNIQSITEAEAVSLYGSDTKRWQFENGNIPYGSEAADIAEDADIIIAACNELIQAGY